MRKQITLRIPSEVYEAYKSELEQYVVKEGQQRINLTLPTESHQMLGRAAAQKGMSINGYVSSLIFDDCAVE